MRRAAIRPFILLLAAAALLAAKPPPPGGARDGRDSWREQGIALCVADLGIVADLSGDDLEAICGCALGRFMDGRAASSLPPLGPGRFRGLMESDLIACASGQRPDRASEIANRGVEPPDVMVEAKPMPTPAGPAAAAPEGARFDPGAGPRWLDLRARLAALPAWAWIAIGFLVILLIGALVRRRDDRRHLLGPPPSMRSGAAPRPRPFRLEL